ncbi:MAG: ribonuclease P protein component [Clostridia bacterium]|nr:ribonuclease P protein component [Clostridia bacterium]
MLRKEYRLQKKYQFNYVYRVGRTVSGKLLVLYYCPSKNRNVKIGISVSHKVGGAVVRNKIKRRIREAVSKHLNNLKVNFNVVLLAKNATAESDYGSLANEIENLLSKAQLFKDKQ